MSNRKQLDTQTIRDVVEDVLAKLGAGAAAAGAPAIPAAPAASPGDAPCRCGGAAPGGSASGGSRQGVYEDATAAVEAAGRAFEQLRERGVEARAKVVGIVKRLSVENAAAWAKMELEETRIGRIDHKVEKLEIIRHVPGVEWLRPDAMSGDAGLTLEEFAPFGVVGAVTPLTHSVPTVAGNIVSIVAAGNAVVFNPHPGGATSAAQAVREFNRAIEREVGIRDLVCTVEQPTLESFQAIASHPGVGLLAVTGGPGVVAAAMKSGKRAICAGPGNPPVVVDATANIDRAARDTIVGAAYDNNLLCIGEKAVFVVESVFQPFLEALARHGGAAVDEAGLGRLTAEAFDTSGGRGAGCAAPVLNRELVGVDPEVLGRIAGSPAPRGCQLLFAPAPADHPFVLEEQMMPFLPVVPARTFEEAVEGARRAEHGYKHSAIIHSLDVAHMTAMARALDTTLFVKNGPCVAGLGLGGEGYLSYSIATTTGEGITTPRTFTRTRRCVMVENLRIV